MKIWQIEDERRIKDWKMENILIFPRYVLLGEWQSRWVKKLICLII